MNNTYYKLERIIRIEYNLFERMFCDKSKRYRIIQHIAQVFVNFRKLQKNQNVEKFIKCS